MSIKRAIGFGALLWILIFFEVSVLMFALKLTYPSTIYYVVHYIFAGILALVVALLYFRKNKAKSGMKEGLFAGVIFAVTGILLDAIITVPLFIKSYSFFANGYLWIGILEGILIVTLVGIIKKR